MFLPKTGKNELLGMPNAQVLTSISMFYWEVTPSEKSVLSLYSVSSIKYHQNMKKFCLMNIMFLKDKHGDGKRELLFETGAHHLVDSMEASPQRLFYCCNNFLFLFIV